MKHNTTAMRIKKAAAKAVALPIMLFSTAVYAQPAAQAEPAAPAVDTQAHAVTLYGLTLGKSLPELQKCTDRMLWYSKGNSPCIEYADGMYSTLGPHLKYGTADEAVIYFPEQMMLENYPKAIAVGLNKDNQMVYFSFYAYGKRSESPDEWFSPATLEDQQHYVAMINKQLGIANICSIRTWIKEDIDEDRLSEDPPENIPRKMWRLSGYDAVIAVWDKEEIWAKCIGEYYSQDKRGFLEIGFKNMFAVGQVPTKRQEALRTPKPMLLNGWSRPSAWQMPGRLKPKPHRAMR